MLTALHRSNATTAGAMIGYSIGNLGKSVVWTSLDTFALFYLVRIGGISPFFAGGLLTMMMVFDAITDVVVAYRADRSGQENTLGRLIIFGAPLCGLSFCIVFTPSLDDLPSVILSALILCRIGYTLCDIGHNTLLVRIASSERNATMISGLRAIFSAIGAGIVGLATARLLAVGGANRSVEFAVAAMIGGAIYVTSLIVALLATAHLPFTGARTEPVNVKVVFRALAKNRQYRIILFLIALQVGLLPLFNRALPFIGEANYGSAAWAGTALTVITLCQLLSLPVWILLTRRRAPIDALLLAYGMLAVGLLLLAARPAGEALMVGLTLVGFAQAGMNLATWAMLALSIRQSSMSLVGNEALPVGLFLAVLKVSAGVGSALMTIAVAASDGWCSWCETGHNGTLFIAATVLPLIGCATGLCALMWSRHAFSVAIDPNEHTAVS